MPVCKMSILCVRLKQTYFYSFFFQTTKDNQIFNGATCKQDKTETSLLLLYILINLWLNIAQNCLKCTSETVELPYTIHLKIMHDCKVCANGSLKGEPYVNCRCGNFHVFKFSWLSDSGTFHKLKISGFYFSLVVLYYNNNIREILEFANLSSSWNSRKLKPPEY